jgi:hypothetical protein
VRPAHRLDLVHDPAPLAVARLAADAPVPAWAAGASGFSTVTRTPDELSLVVPFDAVPPAVSAEGPFVSFRVAGKLEFGLVGVLAALADPLAAAGIPIFAVSTFDTDWILVAADRAAAAGAALEAAGHRIRGA